jgi:hypothetical protein
MQTVVSKETSRTKNADCVPSRSQQSTGNSIAIASPAPSTPGTPMASNLPMDLTPSPPKLGDEASNGLTAGNGRDGAGDADRRIEGISCSVPPVARR